MVVCGVGSLPNGITFLFTSLLPSSLALSTVWDISTLSISCGGQRGTTDHINRYNGYTVQVGINSLEPRLSVPDFVLQLWRKTKLWRKINFE